MKTRRTQLAIWLAAMVLGILASGVWCQDGRQCGPGSGHFLERRYRCREFRYLDQPHRDRPPLRPPKCRQ
jgi:hypothetical protein